MSASPQGQTRFRVYQAIGLSLAASLTLLAGLVLIGLVRTADLYPGEPRYRALSILDREGRVLRSIPSRGRLRGRWTPLEEIPPLLVALTVLAEDQRFYAHPGVDPLALARAVTQNLRAGRVVSGASTLTSQVIRMLHPRPRRWWAKALELGEALALELRWDKAEILEAYLNIAPYGHSLRGVAEASHGFFGKPPELLSPLEAALLVVAPRGPTRLNPSAGGERALARARHLIARASAAGALSAEDATLAATEPARHAAPLFPVTAMHATESIRRWASERADRAEIASVKTTLDRDLQPALGRILRRHLAPLQARQPMNGAVIVLDAERSEVLGRVGSTAYFDEANLGAHDGATLPRQPGSTLKPFVYLLALEEGHTLASVLDDVELKVRTQDGSYRPTDYSGRFAGPVRLRLALANSLNVPAVRLAEHLGLTPLIARLQDLGIRSLGPDPRAHGLGLVLGNPEIPLLELANAYAVLARGGARRHARLIRSWIHHDGSVHDDAPPEPIEVARAEHVALITDVLSDPQARALEFGGAEALRLPFPVAIKTGTSADYRDALVVAYTSEHVVAVWVGSFERAPLPGTPGALAAGPIARDVLFHLYNDHPPAPLTTPPLVEAGVCPLSGAPPSPACPLTTRERFVPGTAPTEPCAWHRHVQIDTRNGLLAGPSCPPGATHQAAVVSLPDRYQAWAKRAGLPSPPERWSPGCPGEASASATGGRVVILSPSDGGRYHLLPDLAPDRQRILGEAHGPATSLEWRLDGAPLGQHPSGAQVPIPLTPGAHELSVSVPGRPASLSVVRFEALGP
jgi:penicillin-binding protein 1C